MLASHTILSASWTAYQVSCMAGMTATASTSESCNLECIVIHVITHKPAEEGVALIALYSLRAAFALKPTLDAPNSLLISA